MSYLFRTLKPRTTTNRNVFYSRYGFCQWPSRSLPCCSCTMSHQNLLSYTFFSLIGYLSELDLVLLVLTPLLTCPIPSRFVFAAISKLLIIGLNDLEDLTRPLVFPLIRFIQRSHNLLRPCDVRRA